MTKFNSETREILDSVKERMDSIFDKEYYVNPDPVVVKTLEDRIEDIIKEYPDYQDSSVVAYKAFLKKGDTVEVNNSLNNGEVFINGKLTTGNYTYMGNDTELIDVVVFETGYYSDKAAWGIKLNTTPTYYPFEIIIRSLNLLPEVEQNYYLFAEKITTYAFNLAVYPRIARIIKADGTNDFTQKISVPVQEISSNCDQFTTSFKGNAYIETIKLPNCKILSGNDRGIFYNCTNLRNWEFGKLTTIKNSTVANMGYIMFSGTHTVYIPETVNTISGVICYNNGNLILDCNKATSIYDGWCNSAPTNFTMAKNWDASINIAVAAKKWSKDRFIELFEDLVPLSEMFTSRELTIPAAIFDSLTEEEYAIAEDKGWVLGGA
jgi:hypothetical protein